ncbi:Protein suppressor of forked-like protein [Dinothrombium tinctorium]|uniref:Protein suppressor of forked-like protein n=1 Tax=Dinothrombium tinctorium TaxID=1965070 RepID=A0A3S3NRT3_9ACAR|nr:Protein suppressor of forked-like protein [Dinothrombium tinctorium]
MAESRIKENAFDIDAWNVAIKEFQNKNIDEARSFYERLVAQFPLSGRYWKLYIEHEASLTSLRSTLCSFHFSFQQMKARNFDKVEKLFQRCLIKVLHIELWRCYLNYIKETKGQLTSFGEKMAQAYDFALDKIGIDIHSYPIWNDYVTFLKNVEAVGSYAENQKITAVRRVYQRGVINPMINIEALWKDYVAYEQGINQIIAEKMIADRSRDYMNARRVAKEYEAVTKGLNRNAPSLPPSSRPEDLKQVSLWKKYIQWEKSNPLRTEDQSLIVKRVIFAYEQCILCLGHYPDIWYEFAAYLEENARIASEKGDINQCKTLQDEVNAVYERATTTLLKNNVLIHFAFADFEEGRNRKEKATEIYNRLLENDDQNFDPTLVYIQYMKFARRSEGIKSARNVFKRAREDSRSGSQVYTCAALMEYYCSKDKTVACKIFELGLKKFGSDPDFILSYIDFLSHLNEENNTRVLFERVLTSGTLPNEKAIEIWNKFLEFESNIGDLSSIIKVEKRRAQALEKICKDVSPTAWLIDRYKFCDLMPCNSQELKSIGYVPRTNTTSGVNYNTASGQAVNGTDYSISTIKPDLRQLIPFKPKINPVPGAHTLPGGIFPPPPAIGSLLSQLPHPSCFHGPFVAIDELIKIFINSTQIPSYKDSTSNVIKPEGIQGPAGQKLFETALKAPVNFHTNNNSNDGHQEKIGFSTKRSVNAEEEDDVEGENSNQLPSFDIYRSRQMQKRVK